MRTRIKFCGCTSARDALLAAHAGADAIGMIFADSPRRIDERTAREIAHELPPFVTAVGVFADPALADIERMQAIFPGLVVQLHGDEAPHFVNEAGARVIKAVHVRPGQEDAAEMQDAAARHPNAMLLFDTSAGGKHGGTGVAFDWSALAPIARKRRIVVSGGLTPENVADCVRTVRPFAVDVRSGIETAGAKDAAKMRAFVQAVRDADAA
ncbi:MAG: N-(5'-phosphoribosyl)anthranilate isomerase [Candidatus Baltobacteraceae bacterium]